MVGARCKEENPWVHAVIGNESSTGWSGGLMSEAEVTVSAPESINSQSQHTLSFIPLMPEVTILLNINEISNNLAIRHDTLRYALIRE